MRAPAERRFWRPRSPRGSVADRAALALVSGTALDTETLAPLQAVWPQDPSERRRSDAIHHFLDALRSPVSSAFQQAETYLRRFGGGASRAGAVEPGRLARAPRENGFTLRLSEDRLIFDDVGTALAAKLGMQVSDLVGRDVQEALPPIFSIRLRAAVSRRLVVNGAVRWLQLAPTPRGRRLWKMAVVALERTGNGVPGRVHGLFHELSDAEQARASARTLGDIPLPGAQVFHYVGTRSGRLEWFCPDLLAYLGLRSEASPKDIEAAAHPDDVLRLRMMRDVSTPSSAALEIRLRRYDGTYGRFTVKSDLVEGLAGERWYGAIIERGEHDPHAGQSPRKVVPKIPQPRLPPLSFELDHGWRLTAATPGAPELLGVAADIALDGDARDTLITARPLRKAVEAALSGGRDSVVEFRSDAWPSRWIECRVLNRPNGAVVHLQDVTERRTAQKTLEPPEQLRGISDAVSAEMLLLDAEGAILSANEAYRATFGALLADHMGRPADLDYPSLCALATPEVDPAMIKVAIGDVVTGRIRRFVHTFVRDAAGGVSILRVSITPVQVTGATRLIVLQEDLTNLARAEASLRDTTAQLLSAQQEERQRIAIELHDSTSQHLTAVGLGMAKLRRIVSGGTQADAVLDDVSEALQEAIKEIRVLSFLMKPAALERNGLAATTEVFVKGFGRRTGLHTSFRAEGRVNGVSEAVAHAGFRVMQEALSNVYKHADASGVEVEIASRGGLLSVRIADDGAGIDMSGAEREGRIGVGIAGMRLRVSQLGGELDISSDGAGTVVLARLPCRVGRNGFGA